MALSGRFELICYTRYYYDSRVHLVPEIDGIRMITTESCEFLQKVPGMHLPGSVLRIE